MRVSVQTILSKDTIQIAGQPPAGLQKMVGQPVVISIQPVRKSAGGKRTRKLKGKQLIRAYQKSAVARQRKQSAGLVDAEYLAACRAVVAARGVVTAEQARRATAGVTADLTALIRAERRGG